MLNDISVLREELLKTFIIHIPHTSTKIPISAFDDYLITPNDLVIEGNISNDVDIDFIFNVEDVEKNVCQFSRLFCDVEKLLINEKMDSVGRGIYHTKTIDGRDLRNFNHNNYWDVITNYYIPYHNKMLNQVDKILNNFGVVRIVDAHSFNGFDSDIDICIGFDSYHTPKYLLEYVVQFFKNKGYVVELNNPYSGTYVPMPFFQTNNNVHSIMIEINKKLYCDVNGVSIKDKVIELKKIINDLFKFM